MSVTTMKSGYRCFLWTNLHYVFTMGSNISFPVPYINILIQNSAFPKSIARVQTSLYSKNQMPCFPQAVGPTPDSTPQPHITHVPHM